MAPLCVWDCVKTASSSLLKSVVSAILPSCGFFSVPSREAPCTWMTVWWLCFWTTAEFGAFEVKSKLDHVGYQTDVLSTRRPLHDCGHGDKSEYGTPENVLKLLHNRNFLSEFPPVFIVRCALILPVLS